MTEQEATEFFKSKKLNFMLDGGDAPVIVTLTATTEEAAKWADALTKAGVPVDIVGDDWEFRGWTIQEIMEY